MKIRNLAGLVVIGAGALAAALTGIGNANASTSACTHGAYVGYCGTFTDHESATALSFDVYHQGAAINQPVIAYFNSNGDKATDFIVLPFKGAVPTLLSSFTAPTDKIVFVEYAPNGVASGLCISEPSKGAGFVLRVCNGLKWQLFAEHAPVAAGEGISPLPEYPGGYFTLVNGATGDVAAIQGLRKQVVGVTDPTKLPTASAFTDSELFVGPNWP